MRSLIRPALFLVARLGLFLAVVAWIAGQTFAVRIDVPFRGFTLHVFACSLGLVSTVTEGDTAFGVYPSAMADFSERQMDSIYSSFGQLPRSHRDDVRFTGPGLTYGVGNALPFVAFTSLRHWLVVTFFVLFNGGLMWVYRDRGKELTVDE